MFFIDPLYIILIGPALLLAIYAQVKVKSAYRRWSRFRASRGLTGAQTARMILDYNGLRDVAVEQASGWLSDHYDPKSRVLRLSPEVYSTPSVAAAGIAAHEAGHALQHAAGYAALRLRNAIVPTAQLGSWLAFPMIIGGVFLMYLGASFGIVVAKFGVVLFAALVAFQVVTLPVELDASRRAKKTLSELGVIQTSEEAAGVSAVLNAAALTYVAATATAIAELLYWVLRLGLVGGSDD